MMVALAMGKRDPYQSGGGPFSGMETIDTGDDYSLLE